MLLTICQYNILNDNYRAIMGRKDGYRAKGIYFERYANKNGRDIPLVSALQVEWKMFGMHMHN